MSLLQIFARCFALLPLTAALACGGGDDGPGGPTDESWTIGIYMAADNNLDRAASSDINEILAAGVPENVSALILVDRAELGEYGSFGEIPGLPPHSTAKWLRITGSTIEELEDLEEINMVDPATVRMFIERLAAEDVDRRAAIFWDHGSSFTYGSDDSAEVPFRGALDVDEVAAEFKVDPNDESSGYQTVDIVGFDACLMSSVEALTEFTDVADLYVASAELEPGDGWDYRAIFDFMGRNPELTPTDLATAIVDGYADYYASNPRRAGGLQVTQAAWSTDTEGVRAAIEALAAEYTAASGDDAGNYNMIADVYQAQARSTFYNKRSDNPAEQTSWIDVGEFLANHTEAAGQAIATAAENLREELEAIRVANRADGREALTMGLSVYFPASRVGRNTGSTDSESRSAAEDSRLSQGAYGDILSLFDPDDPSSAIASLVATETDPPDPPDVNFNITSITADEVRVDIQASDDVMLSSGYGLVLYRTDDGEELAVVGANNDAIGAADYEGEGVLPLRAVTVGPAGAAPESGVVGFLARLSGDYVVPVLFTRGDEEEPGFLLLSDEGAVEGIAALRESAWSSLPWEDAVALRGVEVAPRWYTVDEVTGDYVTNTGDATPISEVAVGFVPLDDPTRLTLLLSATDIAGNTTIASAPFEE